MFGREVLDWYFSRIRPISFKRPLKRTVRSYGVYLGTYTTWVIFRSKSITFKIYFPTYTNSVDILDDMDINGPWDQLSQATSREQYHGEMSSCQTMGKVFCPRGKNYMGRKLTIETGSSTYGAQAQHVDLSFLLAESSAPTCRLIATLSRGGPLPCNRDARPRQWPCFSRLQAVRTTSQIALSVRRIRQWSCLILKATFIDYSKMKHPNYLESKRNV